MTDADTTGMPNETPVQTVERLATLARIRIADERKEALAAEFAHIISYIGQLDELTLSDTKEISAAPTLPRLHNVFRDDGNANQTGEWTDAIVKAFPATAGTALSVKKIISHD